MRAFKHHKAFGRDFGDAHAARIASGEEDLDGLGAGHHGLL
jgi:hypothetical protein